MHVGVPDGVTSVNQASGRIVYSGRCITIAKAVADAGAGGKLIMAIVVAGISGALPNGRHVLLTTGVASLADSGCGIWESTCSKRARDHACALHMCTYIQLRKPAALLWWISCSMGRASVATL